MEDGLTENEAAIVEIARQDEFTRFATDILTEIELANIHHDLEAGPRYNFTLPNGEPLTIDTLILDNSNEQYFKMPGRNIYLIARDKTHQLVGLSGGATKKTPALWYAVRRVQSRQQSQGIGRAMDTALTDWFKRFANEKRQPLLEFISNINLNGLPEKDIEGLLQLRAKAQEQPKNGIIHTLLKAKEAE